jgi:4-cresol dehydrogenase (hydroxylating)
MDQIIHKVFDTIVGAENVISNPEKLHELALTTYQRQIPFLIAVYPKNKHEISQIIDVAREHKLTLHTVSRGTNIGYGTRTPSKSGAVLVDLSRMDQILDYNEQLGYVTVQPGVTFDDLFLFLRKNHSNLMPSVVGGLKAGSLIGNALERGTGTGIYGDRFENLAAIEAIIGTNEEIRTGLFAYHGARSAPLYRGGPGISLIDLFAKTNFGIVTEATIWLMNIPNYFEIILFQIEDAGEFAQLADALHEFRFRSCVGHADMGLFNSKRLAQGMKMNNVFWPIQNEVELKESELAPYPWTCTLCIYAKTLSQLHANEDVFTKAFAPFLKNMKRFSKNRGEIDAILEHEYRKSSGEVDPAPPFPYLPLESIMLGVPSKDNAKICYAEKSKIPPGEFFPEKDLCGTLMLSAPVPFSGQAIADVANLCETIMTKWSFTPSITFPTIRDRVVMIVVFLIYDRVKDGEDERADECLKELIFELCNIGIIPYRLPHGYYELLPKRNDATGQIIKKIKQAFDPDNIFDSGRFL